MLEKAGNSQANCFQAGPQQPMPFRFGTVNVLEHSVLAWDYRRFAKVALVVGDNSYQTASQRGEEGHKDGPLDV